MLNVQTLTNTLSRMPLPKLQEYAALHKNDPYVVSLALSIANQKKQMMAGQAGQAGMMPQPKVVDQDIAQMTAIAPQQQMLPEDIGIGQLPAQNMQRMAEGGIVAFDDGGKVPGYADGVFTGTTARVGELGYEQLMKLYQTDPELAKQAALRAGPAGKRFLAGLQNMGVPLALPTLVGEVGYGLSEKANRDLSKLTPQQRASFYSSPMMGATAGDAGLAAAIQNAPNVEPPTMSYGEQMKNVLSFLPKTLLSAPADKDSPKGYGLTRLLADEPPKPAAPTTVAETKYDPATATRRSMFVDSSTSSTTPPAAPKPVAAAKPVAPAAPAPAPIDPMAGIKALDTKPMTAAEAKGQAAALSDSTELRKQLESNEKFTTDAYEKLLGDYDKNIAKVPEAYKGYEERLKKEEAEAATDKDKALGMAIFQAGLGMMSGTSQYAFENIGKGALAGLENYQSALKDLKKAQRERDKAFADIEAARLAEKRGDIKAHTELQARGIEALGTAKNRTVEGISKIFDVDTRTATGIFETKLKDNAMNERTMYTSAVDIGKQRMADEARMQQQKESDRAALQRTIIQANAPTGIERILSNPKLLSAYKDYATAGTETKGINAFALEAIKDPSLLPRLEAGSAQDRQLAASIKQHMQSMMISPINLPANTPLRP